MADDKYDGSNGTCGLMKKSLTTLKTSFSKPGQLGKQLPLPLAFGPGKEIFTQSFNGKN